MDSSAVKLAYCLSLGCIFAFSHFSEQIYDFLLSRKGSFPDAKYQSALYKKLRPLWQPEHSEKNSASFLIRTRIVVEPRCVVLPHYFFFLSIRHSLIARSFLAWTHVVLEQLINRCLCSRYERIRCTFDSIFKTHMVNIRFIFIISFQLGFSSQLEGVVVVIIN